MQIARMPLCSHQKNLEHGLFFSVEVIHATKAKGFVDSDVLVEDIRTKSLLIPPPRRPEAVGVAVVFCRGVQLDRQTEATLLGTIDAFAVAWVKEMKPFGVPPDWKPASRDK